MNSPQRSRSIFRFAAPHNFYHLAGRLAPWFAAAALALTLAGLWLVRRQPLPYADLVRMDVPMFATTFVTSCT